MNLTVYIGPSNMESSTEFMKKFFLRCTIRFSPQFSAFDPPDKNPSQTGTCHFNGPPPSTIPRNNPRKHEPSH